MSAFAQQRRSALAQRRISCSLTEKQYRKLFETAGKACLLPAEYVRRAVLHALGEKVFGVQ